MPSRPVSTVAAVLLVVSAVLLANPLYLRSPPDRGSVLVVADETSAADALADTTDTVEHVDDLPPVAHVVASEALANGSTSVDRSGPPLALRYVRERWHYLGVQERPAVYRTSIEVRTNETTLHLEPVSLQRVESELGLEPPGRLNETDHPKEVAWLDAESEAVVSVERFEAVWERRLGRAAETGVVTAPNGNDADSVAPLGRGTEYLAHDGSLYRVGVETTNRSVRVEVEPADADTVAARTDAGVPTLSDLDPETQETVREAIDEGSTRLSTETTDVSRLDSIDGRLLRVDGDYYVLYRGHADDIDYTPLFRVVFWLVGAVVGLVGLGVEFRARWRQ